MRAHAWYARCSAARARQTLASKLSYLEVTTLCGPMIAKVDKRWMHEIDVFVSPGAIRGYHVYSTIWEAESGEILTTIQERGNVHD